ncbi:N-carbamoyl-L-amino-acid hydrolase [Pseudomonas sp. NFPP18]|nr:N-carbamoyl-L-amino-acid hydrolase [Pseudomonas sp. NFPP17]SDA89216.1 N-carbamoyl-L-amino-acid hydrolase [Pseudomonas sp. NFPP15]SEM01706.1 N-carbamoyl-L-amino-acid hydrolase [Pseudomonas sp. NFPP18]SFA68548.1 N-carbamoyl-L-amino-acid hydrolase [Pseudomonas sp. NFPP13]SFU12779.1 N-carbamoyl-L-amino-acid hydrolase [Pseudomonas sp. NFPP25]SFY15654.1 N-carbamoyl-L-amino-acid hydrolase [Pseudomonas sp. NFPP16]SFY39519.1 N-carbamoyl-L-amino-acid hydrolase [Pseudomonas sp. NFPP14]
MMLKINGQRLWASLMAMAEIGATARGGSCRLALSDEDRAGRELFAHWCTEAGMSLSVDPIGNLFARRPGSDPDAAPVMMGSHLDTQPEGGRFDGVYGVLAGLEVVRTLNDLGIQTRKPLEVAVWTNEEGARFTPAMFGSAVFTGVMALDAALAVRDADGISVAQALQRTGYAGSRPLGAAVDAYFEAHIEQGPILEDNAKSIGVVSGGQAICWLDVQVEGLAAHAGTTPMPLRKDALYGAAQMILAVEQLAADFAPQGLTTVGELSIAKSSRNTIPGLLSFTVDLRHHQDRQIAAMEQQVEERLQAIAGQRGLKVSISRHWVSPATPFDAECVAAVQQAVDGLGYPQQSIVSGAGHDAILLARYCPTAMVFIPCVGGLSHNEAEDVLPEDVRQGADVLLNAVLARAGQVE